MCGIVGIFNDQEAVKKVKQALALLTNRGKDSAGVYHVGNSAVGHTLHAVVNHVPQPLHGKGILVANCEIYNWRELNDKHHQTATNDAELLLQLLDTAGISSLEELDGVFAFAYWQDDQLMLARDLLGVKPIWYVHTLDTFAFASEKKVLETLGYLDIQELNPRNILIYKSKTNTLKIKERSFFSYIPEHQENETIIKQKTSQLLDQAIAKRIPHKKFGLLFSGGIDSTFLAHYFKEKKQDFTCYTAVLDSSTMPTDLIAAQRAAEQIGLKLKVRKVKTEEIPALLQKIVPLIEDSNVIKAGVALTFYVACEMAKEDGCKVIFSGLGSEEIFAGYERHKNSTSINQECLAGLRKMYERDLYRDDVITMYHSIELRLPFLDRNLVEYALKIPEKYKIVDNITKVILRKIAQQRGIPEEFAFRKKTAAQYGSRFDNALGKLAKKHGFPSKSTYLRQFYPSHNLKLGLLCSSGKDSLSAAYIMHKQNYELACLITLYSRNPDSYMFQTAGTEVVKLQAEAMNLPLVEAETAGEKEKELRDLANALQIAKERYKIDGVISGALFSTYQRDRIEKICDALGLKVFSPLWHKPQAKHLQEIVDDGFDVIITAIAADGLNEAWLGKKMDLKTIAELQKITENCAGEGGEFESVVLDCPLFKKRIKLENIQKAMDSKHAGRLIITKATLLDK